MSELEIIRHAKVGGISIFFDTVEYRTPHFHPEWELIWITDGELAVSCGQTEALCGTGELCLFAPKQVHAFRQRERAATFLCLQIAPQAFTFVYPELNALMPESFQPSLSADTKSTVCALMKRLMGAYLREEAFFELRCASLCAELLGLILSESSVRRLSEGELANANRRNERLERFLLYVDENYTQKITLEDFAESEHCSVSYISRFLKSNLNQSFQDYVNTLRFHCACRLIASGGKRLIDVSEESGFSDYRYFSNCFKRLCGMTPEEYRHRKPNSELLPVQRSLHSLERFYNREESEELLRSL